MTGTQLRNFHVMRKVKLDSQVQLKKGPVKQEEGGKHGGKSKDKGKMHKGLGFQPERGEQKCFGGYCNRCWRIGHKEAQCWFQQEYTKSNPPQDPFQRDIRERMNSSFERARSQPAHVDCLSNSFTYAFTSSCRVLLSIFVPLSKVDARVW